MRTLRRTIPWAASSAVLLAACALVVGDRPASAETFPSDVLRLTEPTCGKPGLPPCPLQRWMRRNVGRPLAANDLKQLAESLDKVATLSPDESWTSWPEFAKAGADAARKGEVAAARKACTGCHKAWRKQYREAFRDRPIPSDDSE